MDARFDKNLFWIGIVYFAGLYLLHFAWWQALVVGVRHGDKLVSHLRSTHRSVGVGLRHSSARLGQLVPARTRAVAVGSRRRHAAIRHAIAFCGLRVPLRAAF